MKIISCSSAVYDCTVTVVCTMTVDSTETIDNQTNKTAEMISVSFAVIALKRSNHSVSVQCVTVAVKKKNMMISRPEDTVTLNLANTEDLSSLIAGLQLNDLMRKKENAVQGYEVREYRKSGLTRFAPE